MQSKVFHLFFILFMITTPPILAAGEEIEKSPDDKQRERLQLFHKMQSVTGVPWYYLAAVNRFEHNIRKSEGDSLISLQISPSKWSGFLNPVSNDQQPASIQFFNGMGKDGNGDHLADSENGTDVLYTFADYIRQFGYTENDIRIALWEYYKRDKTVQIISAIANIYRTYGKLDLEEHAFPIPKRFNYTYHNTWGDSRGWGGHRIHEGTDIFADYGTPVRSTRYGYIEIMGWNRYGGWRIGIRDLDNVYHYYAHLSGFNDELEVGDVVQPGEVIGHVGSSGYGKPGTSGKFPPHLHYGMYKDNGKDEWSFDPYPHLKHWEKDNDGGA